MLVLFTCAHTDTRGAGTDANVKMRLYGEKGDTGERKLDSSENDFERGRVSVDSNPVSWSGHQ